MRVILFTLLFFRSLFVFSQYTTDFPALKLKSISTNDGLNNRATTCINQDKNGLIWVGTNDGLNRLDGYRIKQFFYSPKAKAGLINNVISGMLLDIDGKLWVRTESGICYFDYKSNNFKRLDSNNKTPINKEFDIHLFRNKNTLWAFGSRNYYAINKNLSFKTFNYHIDEKYNITKQGINGYFDVLKNSGNQVWANYGRYLLHLNPENMYPLDGYIIGQTNHEGITKLITRNENIWAATWGEGIICFNTKTKQQKKTNTKARIIHDIAFYKDRLGKEWIVAATNLGYAFINMETFKSNEVILNKEFRSVFVDKKRTIWFATDYGILYSEQAKDKTIKISAIVNASQKNKLNDFSISGSFCSTKNNYFVSLLFGKGQLQFDKNWQLKRYIPSLQENIKNNNLKDIRYIYEKGNILWVTSDAGLSKCDTNLVQQKLFVLTLQNSKFSTHQKLNKIIPMGDDYLLIKGLKSVSVFNLKKEQFVDIYTSTKHGKNILTDDIITGMVLVNRDCYLSTEDGLKVLNLDNKTLKSIALPYTNNRITCMIAGKNGLWLGMQTGLINYNYNTKKFRSYFRQDGLCSDNILAIKLAKNNRLWIATSNGLSCLNLANNKFNNFYQKDGLPDNLIDGGLFIDDAGNVVFGTLNAISILNPQIRLNTSEIAKTATITELSVDGKEQNWIYKHGKKYIEMPPEVANITLHFAIENNINQKYFYNLNNKWQALNSGVLQLNNLTDGLYNIAVSNQPKATGKNDFITIKILPPFYKTWWFYLLSTIIFLSILYLIYYKRIQSIHQKILIQKSYEEKLKEAEMQTLRSQMNPHFIFNTLNSINSYIIENKREVASEYLTTFSKLMRNILDLSKQETITLEKEISTLNLYLELESLRLENKFDYSIIVDKELSSELIKIPPLIIQPFVENAIWHGLHNKKENGYILIKIIENDKNQLLITVEDDGIGRKASALLKKQQVNHKSYGIEITINRLHLLNENNSIEIVDLYENEKATGTKVAIKINLD